MYSEIWKIVTNENSQPQLYHRIEILFALKYHSDQQMPLTMMKKTDIVSKEDAKRVELKKTNKITKPTKTHHQMPTILLQSWNKES